MKKRNVATCSLLILASLLITVIVSCAQAPKKNINNLKPLQTTNKTMDTATFGAGCFWCVEAVFQNLKGVVSLESGFSGGHIKNPSYREVCMGTTGHAEVCQLVFNSKEISYAELLEVFWQTHDPTQLNKQGNDEGTQYRSSIFYHNESQKEIAEKYKRELSASGAWDKPLVTEIVPFTIFYKADDYHQNYFNQNGDAPYCQYVIQPKVDKFKKVFKDKLKK